MARYTLHAVLNHRKTDKGGVEMAVLKLRVKWGGIVCDISTGYSVAVDKFSLSERRCRNNSWHGADKVSAQRINKAIERIERRVAAVFASDNIPHSSDGLRALVGDERDPGTKKGLFDVYQDFIAAGVREARFVAGTVKKHRTVMRHLHDFAPGLAFGAITRNTFAEFGAYLVQCMSNATARKDLMCLRTFLNWAVDNNYTDNVAWRNYRNTLRTAERQVIFLAWEELMRLYGFDFSTSPHLDRARDVFCFCCFTSLRYSDVAALEKCQVYSDALRVVTQKTNDSIEIELNKYSRAILTKYAALEGRFALPVISNQKYNVYIKEACRLAGIDAPVKRVWYQGVERMERSAPKWEFVASHTARRTFISNALMMGITPEIVMRWTGHSDYRAMLPYIAIADKAKREAMSAFDRR